MPAAQVRQLSATAPEYVPAEQLVQLVDAAVGAYVPGLQLVQMAEAEPE